VAAPDRAIGNVVPLYVVGNTVAKLADEEARRAPRRRMLKAGTVAFNGGHSTTGCTVRDLSSTGARLRADGSVGIPDTFKLIIELDGLEADCEVVWRKDSEVGARFVGAPRIVTPKRTQIISPVVPPQKASLRRKPK
jgi:hypothetical protein